MAAASCPKLGTARQYYAVAIRIDVAERPRARTGGLAALPIGLCDTNVRTFWGGMRDDCDRILRQKGNGQTVFLIITIYSTSIFQEYIRITIAQLFRAAMFAER